MLNLHNVSNRVAFALIFGGNGRVSGRVKSHRFSYEGTSDRQLAQLIFVGKNVAMESSNRTNLGEEDEKHFFRAYAAVADGCRICGIEPGRVFLQARGRRWDRRSRRRALGAGQRQ